MEPWTPEQRNAFIKEAVNCTDRRKGWRGSYSFQVLPKLGSSGSQEAEDPKRAAVTAVLSEVLNRPAFKIISMSLYAMLGHKLATHPVVGYYFNRDVVMQLKGSNAHAYLARIYGVDSPLFANSDMDIAVCVNPFLPKTEFDELKKQVEIVVKQTLSQYKRSMDHPFFLNKAFDNPIVNPKVIEGFKKEFTSALAKVDVECVEGAVGAVMCSPFESDEFRNLSSRNSFLLTNSMGQENSVVLVDVPHFDRCEKIPLRKTPMFCSFNETIDFVRDKSGDQNKKGCFNLYRLKLNVLCQHFDEEGGVVKDERIPADFIDVSVPDQSDVELLHFWSRGRSINIFDQDTGIWVTIPDMETVVMELKRIVNEYDCPDGKKEKRMAKLAVFERYVPPPPPPRV